MKLLSRFAVSFALLLPAVALAQGASSSQRTPVLVELFTSEGCSSCPPADKLLAALKNQQPVANANIVVLEEHVDYWDRLGWRDRFSSAQFTQRQRLYAPRLRFDDPYTPQMVVDGQAQFVGSDPSSAISSITKAAGVAKIHLELTRLVVEGRSVTGSVSTENGVSLPKGDLYAVLVSPSVSTEVRAGENGGRRLDHVNVARSFARIGKLQDLARGPVKVDLEAPSDVNPSQMKLIVFAQISDQGAVRGVAEAALGSSQ